MIKLELLAPAKDTEHGKAAINHGADAVYIGAPKFSARKAAVTSIQQIEELTRYAHLFNAKVYVALNTILYNDELNEAEKLIYDIYNAGADALIIQDMGILEMNLPPLPLFASTQTHNTTPEKVLFLEKVGFKRVILARELSTDEITSIRAATTVELESFVHGALCVSYSGQCYLSQSVCGRSGNRGDCAQPCRSAYDLVDSENKIIVKNKHLLSLKDLNLSLQIPDLIRAGITSFKIEGRLKDLSYVKNIVSNYRKAIDNFIEHNQNFKKSSSGVCTINFEPDPEKTFNRGYTLYNINGRTEKLSTYYSQKSVGTKVGQITKIAGSKIFYQGEKLNSGDGICFYSKENELKGFNVNRLEAGILLPSNVDSIYEGAVLYRNFDITFENLLKQSQGNRRIPVEMHLTGDLNVLKLTIKDEDATEIALSEALNGLKANNSEQAENILKNQLVKVGNTPLKVKTLSVNLSEVPFLQVSQINEFRRKAIELFLKERQQNYKPDNCVLEPNSFPFPVKAPDFRANVSNRLAEQFYTRHGAKVLEKAYELDPNVEEEVLMETKHCIRFQLDACLLTQKNNTLKEPLFLKDQKNIYRLKFKCKECVMQVLA